MDGFWQVLIVFGSKLDPDNFLYLFSDFSDCGSLVVTFDRFWSFYSF